MMSEAVLMRRILSVMRDIEKELCAINERLDSREMARKIR